MDACHWMKPYNEKQTQKSFQCNRNSLEMLGPFRFSKWLDVNVLWTTQGHLRTRPFRNVNWGDNLIDDDNNEDDDEEEEEWVIGFKRRTSRTGAPQDERKEEDFQIVCLRPRVLNYGSTSIVKFSVCTANVNKIGCRYIWRLMFGKSVWQIRAAGNFNILSIAQGHFKKKEVEEQEKTKYWDGER